MERPYPALKEPPCGAGHESHDRVASRQTDRSESFPKRSSLPNGERYMLNAAVVATSLRNGNRLSTLRPVSRVTALTKRPDEIGMASRGECWLRSGGWRQGPVDRWSGRRNAYRGALVGKRGVPPYCVRHRVEMELSRPLEMTPEAGGQ